MRIGDLVERTGVSRELIHHYLRQGLLPSPEEPARYDEEHERLLQQIKVLRDEHHLPLDTIRAVFDFFRFEPARLEALTLADSFANRMGRMVASGGSLSTRLFDAEELAQAASVGASDVARYAQAGLIEPHGDEPGARFSSYDARVIAVCVRAEALGIPFDTLRTIGAFVRIAFELEHPLLFPDPFADPASAGTDGAPAPSDLLREVVVRLELVTSLIQSLLQGLVAAHLSDRSALAARAGTDLDALVYRPSPSFVRRHGLGTELTAAQRQLGARPRRRAAWSQTIRLLLSAGRDHEALFFAEQAAQRWPNDPGLRALLGRALLHVGQTERGLSTIDGTAGAVEASLRAMVRLAATSRRGAPELAVVEEVVSDVETALGRASAAPAAERLECQAYAGWTLAALPAALGYRARGIDLLRQTLTALDSPSGGRVAPTAERDRLRINAAWLLHDVLASVGSAREERESLRMLICRLDPGCSFAESVFQETDGHDRPLYRPATRSGATR